MSKGKNEFVLPTRLARKRLLAGRLVLGVAVMNLVLALALGWALTGPAAGLTRFRLGFFGWAALLFAASILLTVPLLAPILRRLLRPPAGE